MRFLKRMSGRDFRFGRAPARDWLRMILFIMAPAFFLSGAYAQNPPPTPTTKKSDAAKSKPSAVVRKSDALKKLRDEYERLDIKENFSRYAAFTILQQFLPAGTKFTSGFRNAEEQLRVIETLARNYNAASPPDPIPMPETSLTLPERNVWEPVLLALREHGYIISSPLSTPHATGEVVFDMSGASLDAILRGCQRAEIEGWMKFSKLLPEPINNAIHVEVAGVGAKTLQILGGGSLQVDGVASGTSQQLRTLQELKSQHDAAADLNKKIDYDLQRIQILNLTPQASFTDTQSVQSQIQQLEGEIDSHAIEIEQRARNQRKTDGFERLKAAASLELAEQIASQLATEFPDDEEAQKALGGIKSRRSYTGALDIFLNGNCEASSQAKQYIANALNGGDENQNLQRIKREIDSWASRCSTTNWLWIALAIAGGGGLIAAAYFFMRPTVWELKCLDGPVKGQSFPLEQPITFIGALPPPEGEADIVLDDRKRRISRTHCVIWREKRAYYVKDESANGTLVNGQPISKEEGRLLQNRDEISLGGAAVLIFQKSHERPRKSSNSD